MLLQAGQVNRQVTKKDLQLKSKIDIQGIDWSYKSREAHFSRHIDMMPAYFSTLDKRPIRPKTHIQAAKPFLRFNKFVHEEGMYLRHQQIHNNCKSLGENQVLFISYFGLSVMNMSSLTTKKLVRLSGAESLAYSPSLNFAGGVHSETRIFLCDLDNNKLVLDFKPFDDSVHTANKLIFIDAPTPQMMIAGNTAHTILFDIESQKPIMRTKSLQYINDLDYSAKQNLVAFAMDCKAIQVKDPRDNNNIGLILEGHQDYNFCVKFLNNYELASGGEDVSARIWDLRKTGKELHVLDGFCAGVSAMDYSPSQNLLFCIENFGYVYGYDLNNKIVEQDSVTFFGFASGLSLTPSEKSLFVSITKTKPGILKLDIETPEES